MGAEQKLKDMGLELGPVGTPVANFVPTVQTGNLLYVAGHIAGKPDGSVLNPGKVGREVTERAGLRVGQTGHAQLLGFNKTGAGEPG